MHEYKPHALTEQLKVVCIKVIRQTLELLNDEKQHLISEIITSEKCAIGQKKESRKKSSSPINSNINYRR